MNEDTLRQIYIALFRIMIPALGVIALSLVGDGRFLPDNVVLGFFIGVGLFVVAMPAGKAVGMWYHRLDKQHREKVRHE